LAGGISAPFAKVARGLLALDRRVGGRESYAVTSILLIAVSVAFMVRILPARWGFILSEFDPWLHFRAASMIVERGWAGFFEFGGLVEPKAWYPTGLPIGRVLYPGVSFTLAFIYLSLSSLGIKVDLMELASILPVVYGMIAVVITFLLARRVLGTGPALASALLLSVSYAHISRTHLGWLDDEALSIPLMHAAFLTYLASIDEKRSAKGAAVLGLLTGLLLGYTGATWGAHRFPIMLVLLFTGLLVFMGRYRRQLLFSFTPLIAALAAVMASVPKLGPTYLTEITLVAGYLVLLYLVFSEAIYRYYGGQKAVLAVRGLALGFLLLAILATLLEIAGLPGLKFLSVLVPTLRQQLVIIASVAENQPATWATLFNDFGPTLLLAPMGIYLLLKRRGEGEIFLAIYALLSLYFASSLVRLALPTSPIVAIVAGFVIHEMLARAAGGLAAPREAPRLRRGEGGRKVLIVVPLLVVALIAVNYLPRGLGNTWGFSSIDAAYMPSTITAASLPISREARVYDWLRAVEWMRNNLPPDAVVASWWDYGNWITHVGNRSSLVDNTTIDTLKIAKVGYAFMSPANVSVRLFKELGATHVLIFVTHRPQLGAGDFPRLLYYGDESKWIWMLRIANQNAKALGLKPLDEAAILGPNRDPTNPADKFWTETTLGRMIPFKPRTTTDQFGNVVVAHYYEEPAIEGYRLVYSSSAPYTSLAYVYIYEITG
jgi:dolichyl-diphosphooligosaccharide--protein glycosyltransferase